MEATLGTPRHNSGLSEGMARANNHDFSFNANTYLMSREPDYYVYIHTVAEQSFDVSRPPIISLMKLVGKTAKQKSALCARFPQPLLTPQSNVDSNETTIGPMDCRRFVMDIVNPDNLGNKPEDQDAVITSISAVGNNLGAKGVFWSLNEIPTEVEINAAVARMERYYKKLTEEANTVEASAPAKLPDTLTPEHHAAADYITRHFGTQFKWHTALSRLESCELCGEQVKAGIAFHRTEEGGVCVRDWARTVKSGARTRAQAYEATGDEQFAPKVATVATPASQAPAAQPEIPTEE
jgi:hypothetical protein